MVWCMVKRWYLSQSYTHSLLSQQTTNRASHTQQQKNKKEMIRVDENFIGQDSKFHFQSQLNVRKKKNVDNFSHRQESCSKRRNSIIVYGVWYVNMNGVSRSSQTPPAFAFSKGLLLCVVVRILLFSGVDTHED